MKQYDCGVALCFCQWIDLLVISERHEPTVNQLQQVSVHLVILVGQPYQAVSA